jgi:hypothetical protein
LRAVSDEKTIRYALQILPPVFWPRIDEAARLRIENKLIRSINEGTASSSTRRSTKGTLGTWARDYAEFFILKRELYITLLEKLTRSADEQAYIALYFWYVLPNAFEQPANQYVKNRWIEAICGAVSDSRGSSIVREKLLDTFFSFPEDLRGLILERLKPLETEDPDFYSSLVNSGEIPF